MDGKNANKFLRAFDDFRYFYDIAVNSSWVMKPAAWALYQTWKKWDKIEKIQKKKEDN